MSGLVAQLEDARELAEKLKDALGNIASGAAEGMNVEHAASGAPVGRLADLADAADDLVSRIDNLRTALRGT